MRRPLLIAVAAISALLQLPHATLAADLAPFQKLAPAAPPIESNFGAAVAFDGATLAVGNPVANRVTVYRSALGAPWSEIDDFGPSDAPRNNGFGFQIAMSGDALIIGAITDREAGQSTGAAYIYQELSPGAWTSVAKLRPSDGVGGDQFGAAVAIRGDTAIVGAPRSRTAPGVSAGAAYVFRRDGAGAWNEVGKLTSPDVAGGGEFGRAISLSGDGLLVGAPHADGAAASTGAAILFREQPPGVWQQMNKIFAADGTAGDLFGVSVAIDGNQAVVGAPYDDDGATNAGAAYAFALRGGASWTHAGKLLASDPGFEDLFGSSVALAGGLAVVGAPWVEDAPFTADHGAAFAFAESGGSWTLRDKLVIVDPLAGDGGYSVATDGRFAFAGARDTVALTGYSSGAVYAYSVPEPSAQR